MSLPYKKNSLAVCAYVFLLAVTLINSISEINFVEAYDALTSLFLILKINVELKLFKINVEFLIITVEAVIQNKYVGYLNDNMLFL